MDTECTTTYKLKNQIGLLEIHSWWATAVLRFIKQDKFSSSCLQLENFFWIRYTSVITVMVTSELIRLWFLRSFLTWASVRSMLFSVNVQRLTYLLWWHLFWLDCGHTKADKIRPIGQMQLQSNSDEMTWDKQSGSALVFTMNVFNLHLITVSAYSV